jgi:phage terminase large subunit-like protein
MIHNIYQDWSEILQELLLFKKNKTPSLRENQRMPPGDWRIWLIMAGRGFGKTYAGSETIRQWALASCCRIGLIGYSFDETRKIMVEGHSGLLSLARHDGIVYYPSQNKIRWPNGSEAFLLSASSPEKLRGLQFHFIWIDEWAKFPSAQEVFEQANIILRLGPHPKMIITTTPKPIGALEHLLKRNDIALTRGSVWDNKANLSSSYMQEIEKTYQNTDLEGQELRGVFVAQKTHCWWTRDNIINARYAEGSLDNDC